MGGVLYIKLRDDRVTYSDEVEPGIIVDYNGRGETVDIEVLWFLRRKIDLSKPIPRGPEALVAKM